MAVNLSRLREFRRRGLGGLDWAVVALLTAAAFVGNYYAVPLMFGVDVLLGGVFIYVLLLQYGLGVALLASLPGLLATWALWNHPYAAVLLLIELILLGFLLRRRSEREPPLVVALLWVPWLGGLCFLFYHGPLGLPLADSLLVMLKQALNSIANAVLAVVLSTLVSLRWPGNRASEPTARQVLFYIPASVVVLVVVLMLFTVSRMQLRGLEAGFVERLAQTRQTLVEQIRTGVSRLEESLARIDRRCISDTVSGAAAAQCVETLLPFSDWDRVLLRSDTDSGWRVFGPEGSETPTAQASADLDDIWFQVVGNGRDDYYLGSGGELYLFLRYDHDNGGWIGGEVQVNEPGQDLWRPFPDPAQRQSWHLDGAEILTSGPPLSSHFDLGEKGTVNGRGLRHFVPGDGDLSPMKAWSESVYYQDFPVEQLGLPLPGRLRLELSPRPEQLRLYGLYTVLLVASLLFILIVLIISHWAADWLMRPTRALIAAAEAMPRWINRPPEQWHWPDRLVVREMRDLQNSLEDVSRLLHGQYQRERLSRQWLEDEVAERTRDLRAAQQHINSILTNMEGVLFSAERIAGRVRLSWISPAVRQLTGYPPSDWIGEFPRLRERIHPTDRSRLAQELQSMLERRRGEFSMQFRHADGDYRYLRVRYWTVEDTVGGSPRLDGLVTDNTDWHVAQRKIREQEALLIQQARSAALGEMLSNIAHQWRQPLNSLALVQANLRDAQSFGELSDDYLKESLDRADALVARMNQTVRDFLTFFRPGREPERFDLTRTVRDGLTLMEHTLHSRPMELRSELAGDLWVSGYPNELIQVLMVLIQNSREALEERQVETGLIDVTLEEADGEARLSVEDNAGGQDEATLARVFDPYFTTKAEGTGIGLYMARSLIENQMDGRIGVVNGAAGARFTLYLPLC